MQEILAFCAIRNINKLTADALANIQNVIGAPNFWTRNPPIKLPHPEPSPQYTPWSMPCMVARLSGGITVHIQAVRALQTPADVQPNQIIMNNISCVSSYQTLKILSLKFKCICTVNHPFICVKENFAKFTRTSQSLHFVFVQDG